MKILITGGSGFIGRNLTDQLSKRYKVDAPSSKELDLCDQTKVRDYLKKQHFDAVIHAATWNATCNSDKDTSKVLTNNTKMFFNIARCSDLYGKMIYFGSGAEYDKRHYVPRMSESYFKTHVPVDEYGFSKYAMAKYAQTVDNIYNLRLFGVFGKHEDWEIRFISNACCKAVYDLPVTVNQNVYFDYLYINDLVNITNIFLTNSPEDTTFNVCTSRPIDLLSLARKVVRISGKDIEIVVKKDGIGREYSGDNSKMMDFIGDYSFSPIDTYIRELFDWYAERKDSIKKELLLVDKGHERKKM